MRKERGWSQGEEEGINLLMRFVCGQIELCGILKSGRTQLRIRIPGVFDLSHKSITGEVRDEQDFFEKFVVAHDVRSTLVDVFFVYPLSRRVSRRQTSCSFLLF